MSSMCECLDCESAMLMDARVATVEQEKPDPRPKCDWVTNKGKPSEKECGSERELYKVTRKGGWGATRNNDICQDHILDAHKKWSIDSAEKPKR